MDSEPSESPNWPYITHLPSCPSPNSPTDFSDESKVKLWYQTIDALWYPSAGQQLLRIVVVRDPSGRRRDDCIFSTDLTLSATQILELISRRWPLEVCLRDVKQFLGFEDPQNRVAKATTRTAPLIRRVAAAITTRARP